jgi:prephenate dehydrogenase
LTRMTKIAIFGVGLIGGSLALCFKGKPGIEVVGHSYNPASVDKYMKRNVVDYATTSLQEAAEGADFLFLCVPVGKLEEYLLQLNEIALKPGCIITDVGSTKVSITHCARRLELKGVHFIGGHPMAGKERSGVEAASSHLFENAYYVLTPDAATPPAAFDRLVELLRHTKAHIVRLEAALHDDIVAAVSHLPHIIAAALVNQVSEYNESNDLYESLAAGGFRDITRIASSDPVIWRDILMHNREVLLKLLKDWNRHMFRFTRLLEQSDAAGIENEFKRASNFRSKLPERRKGVLTSFYDIYVDVPDHPGIIGQIATLLGKSGISLSNIQVIESREEVPGVLRLSFREQDDLDKAVSLLGEHQYAVHL